MALLVVLWYIGTLIWTVTASIALTIVIAAVLAPYVLRLRDGGRSRTAAAAIVWVVALLVGIGLLLLLAIAFLPHVADLLAGINTGTDDLRTRLEELQLPAWIGALVDNATDVLKGTSGDAVAAIVGTVGSVVGILILTTFLLFFFLRDGDKAWLWFFQDLGEERRWPAEASADASGGAPSGRAADACRRGLLFEREPSWRRTSSGLL